MKTQDFESFIKVCKNTFDLVFLDPPYKAGVYERCLKLLREEGLLNKDAVIALEADAAESFADDMFSQFSLLKERKYGRVKLYILQGN